MCFTYAPFCLFLALSRTHTQAHTDRHACMYADVYMHAHTHTHMYMHTCIYFSHFFGFDSFLSFTFYCAVCHFLFTSLSIFALLIFLTGTRTRSAYLARTHSPILIAI